MVSINFYVDTLKKCSFLKIENNSFRVNFNHYGEKATSHTWVDENQLNMASLHAYKIGYLKWKVRMILKAFNIC